MNMKRTLILGDALALLLVTIIGFATHGETELAFLPRLAAAFVPLTLAWFLLAPWFGLFDESTIRDARQLWRPALTVLFAAPLAVILRAAWLNAAALPLFALIFGLTNALGMVLWRGLWLWLAKRKS